MLFYPLNFHLDLTIFSDASLDKALEAQIKWQKLDVDVDGIVWKINAT